MVEHVSQPRMMLRRLHRVMAGNKAPQAKLEQIVQVIAQNMVAEVCSIYLRRAGSVFELFATEGLNQEAVHITRMQVGEGLVGLVAERALPLNLSDASTHPRFSYRAETGEDLYHSFLGVPIQLGGKVRGVLVVQNIASRRYYEEEVEALQTIAMVLAELVGSGDLVATDEVSEEATDTGLPVILEGTCIAEGIAWGKAVFHTPRAAVSKTIADDPDKERQRIEDGITQMREQLEEMVTHPDLAKTGETKEVLDTYLMFAFDPSWYQRLILAVDSGLTAEAAVERVQQENRAKMQKARDSYLRERLPDLEDLANRLIRIIQVGGSFFAHDVLNEDAIVVARSMGPAEIMDYDRKFLRGIVLEEGSPTAHVAIIARAMGIPILGRVAGLVSHIDPGDVVVVDAVTRRVYVRPAEDTLEAVASAIGERAALYAAYEEEKSLPSVTTDGTDVTLMMNSGMRADLPLLSATGAQGVGLFRTEFQFMISPLLPRVAEQQQVYSDVLKAAGDLPVVFRTLDIGGDKKVPFLPRMEEENPAMGWRAIRVALDRPALLRYQLRALVQAADGKDLYVMFPMIAEVPELKAAKAMLDKEVVRAEKYNKGKPRSIKVGAMLEVPSLAWQMDHLLREVDFLSIGTNDLMQFFFACDRSNPELANRYDLLCPPVLKFLQMVIKSCDEAGVPVTLCGEMGGRPLEAMALLGLGLRRFSVSPASIGPVKRMIRTVKLATLADFMDNVIHLPDHSLRQHMIHYARDHNIIV